MSFFLLFTENRFRLFRYKIYKFSNKIFHRTNDMHLFKYIFFCQFYNCTRISSLNRLNSTTQQVIYT